MELKARLSMNAVCQQGGQIPETKANVMSVTSASFEEIVTAQDGVVFSAAMPGTGALQQHDTGVTAAFLIQFKNGGQGDASISVPMATGTVAATVHGGGLLVMAYANCAIELTGPVSVVAPDGEQYELVVAGE